MFSRKFLCVFLFLSVVKLSGQNWSVFNKAYRYNYKYDNSVLITQVIFADSVKAIGTSTVHFMNRIGVECTGSCPTLTATLNPTQTVVVPNMPQFFQRKIIQYPGGIYTLKDTATLVIKGECQVLDTWLFDSINNKFATCISKNIQTVFGIIDSVKTVLINGADTLKLSKQFGILQFPNLYNKNKYFALKGIENSGTYEASALYGQKVPNAWDFYLFDAGDRFCEKGSIVYTKIPSTYWQHTKDVMSRTITATGYTYAVAFPPSTNIVIYKYDSLMTSNYVFGCFANKMYPGQIISSTHYNQVSYIYKFSGHNIVRFGLDAQGRFYKIAGVPCSAIPNINIFNNTTFFGMEYNINGYMEDMPWSKRINELYGVGLGMVSRQFWHHGEQFDDCLTCASKSGVGLWGTEIALSLEENNFSGISVYPNPNIGSFVVDLNETNADELKILNTMGQLVYYLKQPTLNENTTVNIEKFPSGLFFVQILNKDKLVLSEKILKE